MKIQASLITRTLVPFLCILLLAAIACSLPNISGLFGSEPELPEAILTNAAATIMTRIGATQTQEAAAPPPATAISSPSATFPPPTSPPGAPAPTETSPISYPPPLTTNTPSFTNTATNTTAPTSTTTSTATRTVPPHTSVPTHTRMAQLGTHFFVDGVNLPYCYGSIWAVFAIYNNGTNALESMYLFIKDVTTGANRLGPLSTNTPFMNSDRSCALQGIDTLGSGGVLFVGGKLNSNAIKGHTLRATIKLCSAENLSGSCFQTSMDFVVP